MNALVVLLIAVLVLSGCSSNCNWQPKKSYGVCEMFFVAGVYYDNAEGKCKVLTHSGCSKADTPFEIDSVAFYEKGKACNDFSDDVPLDERRKQYAQCAAELKYSPEFVNECKIECEK